MKEHRDIVKVIDKEGLDALPLIKVNGKIMKEKELESFLKKKFTKVTFTRKMVEEYE